jgi:predicted DNA-binding antitoxin AbrB/MazE fold protein
MEISLSIDDDLKHRIQGEAERLGCSVSELLDRSVRLLLGQAQEAGSVSPPVAERSLVIHAAFENGVLRPTEPVELPESSVVEVEVRQVKPPTGDKRIDMDDIYEILSERFDSGDSDVAARHNEHQP